MRYIVTARTASHPGTRPYHTRREDDAEHALKAWNQMAEQAAKLGYVVKHTDTIHAPFPRSTTMTHATEPGRSDLLIVWDDTTRKDY